MIAIYVTFILVILVGIIVFLALRRVDKGWIAIVLSFFALVISLFSTFKGDLLPSNLVLIGNEIIFIGKTPPDPQTGVLVDSAFGITFVFPLGFFNKGYSEDIVENVSLKITNTNDGSTALFNPIIEVDLQHLMQSVKQGINSEDIIGTFAPFVIQGKAFFRKAFVFEEDGVFKWTPGNYKFEIFVKLASDTKPKQLKRMTFNITRESLTSWAHGIRQDIIQP